MKLFISILALSISLSGLASTGETKSFTFDGSQDSVDLLLKGEKTHTEYKVEDVPSTCYREVMVGYQTICTGGGYGGGYGRRYPGPYTQHCFQRPIYRSVPYSCIRTVRTPFEVKDFDVDTKVTLNISAANAEGAKEKLTVSLLGDRLTLTMNGSKKFIGVLKTESVDEQMAGSVKIINAAYNVELVDVAGVTSALTMKGISAKSGLIRISADSRMQRSDISFTFKIVKKNALASDVTFIDRVLENHEFKLENNDIVVDPSELHASLYKGKWAITAKLSFNGKVLNHTELPALETSRTLILKK